MSAQSDADLERDRDLMRRILAQRLNRFGDVGPDLAPVGAARFRRDGRRLLIAYAVAHPGMAANVVERVQAYATEQSLWLRWIVTPEAPGEAEFPSALSTAGFRLDERLILMVRSGAITTPINPEVRIALVTGFDAMRAYEYGSRRSFYDDDKPDERMVASRAADRWRQQEQGWYRYYIAVYRNRVVGGCYVTLWEDVQTLMGVYTVAEARGQGIATTMLAQVTGEIVRSGRDSYCLYVKHDNPAQRLYRRLGFAPMASEETHLWPNEQRP
ncbi:MAG TPA: GNAT family N-acetyltransferase [Ktedonobacterales bacterium]|jgi:ribosomal protein S18 acetylase RimI-like enzyme|nr:GNAT family N-acetyltransferase [Ktedonobacterales bacterium]